MSVRLLNNFLIGLFICCSWCTSAQVTLSGKVTDSYGRGVEGVRVFIDKTYYETISDSVGYYAFQTPLKGTQLFIAASPKYQDVYQEVDIRDENMTINIQMDTRLYNISTIEITVAKNSVKKIREKQKATKTINAVEIGLTAVDGDLISGINMLAGTQPVGESGQLFVRGGEGNETRLFIDGLTVQNYTRATISGQSSASRFPTSQFSGNYFSSGGYGSAYGQALSSILNLDLNELPYQSSREFSLSPIFIGGEIDQLSSDRKKSYGIGLTYFNLSLYDQLFSPSSDKWAYEKAPWSLDGTMNFKKSTSETGIIKFFTNYSFNGLKLWQRDVDQNRELIDLKNQNMFSVLSFKEKINKWRIRSGLGWSVNRDQLAIDTIPNPDMSMVQTDYLSQVRTEASRDWEVTTLTLGGEYQYYKSKFTNPSGNSLWLKDHLPALFAEFLYYPRPKTLFTFGLRNEYSSLLKKNSLSPRFSFLYTVNNSHSFQFSTGLYSQKPGNNFLLSNDDLIFNRASHFIGAYQYNKRDRLFRAEIYSKYYHRLINILEDDKVDNSGEGYAHGLDLTWRDKASVSNLEFWATYSFIKSERNYLRYPDWATPSFISPHSLQLVVKKFIPKISTNVSLNYSFGAGRTYLNPNQDDEGWLSDKTPNYHNLNLNVAYITEIQGAFAVMVLTVKNVTGRNHVFGYEYSNENPQLREAISPFYKTFIFGGVFLSFGVDNTDQFINDNL